MGLGLIDYALHIENHPSLLVVTDINEERLSRARKFFPTEEYAKIGITIRFENTSAIADVSAYLLLLVMMMYFVWLPLPVFVNYPHQF